MYIFQKFKYLINDDNNEKKKEKKRKILKLDTQNFRISNIIKLYIKY